MTVNAELGPCPFCGEQPEFTEDPPLVMCECGARIGRVGRAYKNPIATWNRRAAIADDRPST